MGMFDFAAEKFCCSYICVVSKQSLQLAIKVKKLKCLNVQLVSLFWTSTSASVKGKLNLHAGDWGHIHIYWQRLLLYYFFIMKIRNILKMLILHYMKHRPNTSPKIREWQKLKLVQSEELAIFKQVPKHECIAQQWSTSSLSCQQLSLCYCCGWIVPEQLM